MLGAIIGGATSLLGGLLGKSSQEKQMDQQIAAQKQFAKNGIQWKVQDANKAGIHPLYALGAQTHSFAPIGVGGNPLGEGIAAAGQEIGRAVTATQPASERAYTSRLQALQLQRGELENALLASNLARLNSPAQVGPAMPSLAPQENNWLIDGQGNTAAPAAARFGGPIPSALVDTQPMQRTASDPSRLHQEPGAINELGWARTAGGGYAPVPSADVKQRIDDQIVPQIGWAMRNIAGPTFSAERYRPPFPAPAGQEWFFSIPDAAYYLRDRSPRSGGGGW